MHNTPFTSLAEYIPKPVALEPFSVMSLGRNVLRNSRFTEGKTGWTGNDTTELSLRRLVDDEFGYAFKTMPSKLSALRLISMCVCVCVRARARARCCVLYC